MPRKPTAKQIQNEARARVERVYRARCNGIQVPILKIGEIMRVGLESIAAGADDQVLGDTIAAFVETIRAN